nr:unnamed protein product [Digitaria exilis]
MGTSACGYLRPPSLLGPHQTELATARPPVHRRSSSVSARLLAAVLGLAGRTGLVRVPRRSGLVSAGQLVFARAA